MGPLGDALVGSLARTAAALPFGPAERAGNALGDWRRRLRPREAATVRANLRRLGLSGADGRDEERLVRETFRAFGLFAVEFFRGLTLSPEEITRGWRIEGAEHLERLAADRRGFIAAGAHTGNWEQLRAILHPLGRSIVAPVEEQFHPLLSAAVKRAKGRWRVASPPARRDLRALLRALERGALVALPLDGGAYRGGIEVDLLGARVRLARGAAQLSVLSGRPVVCVFSRRTGFMTQSVRVLDPLTGPGTGAPRERVDALTRTLAARLGEQLRATPGQWCVFRPLV
jgi:phosphatidylinositol dimannoside acyltransferase